MVWKEKWEGAGYPTLLIEGFNEALNYCGLDDLHMIGGQFIWEWSRGKTGWLKEKLDRALAMFSWISKYLNY